MNYIQNSPSLNEEKKSPKPPKQVTVPTMWQANGDDSEMWY
jgi:hypothetical protein